MLHSLIGTYLGHWQSNSGRKRGRYGERGRRERGKGKEEERERERERSILINFYKMFAKYFQNLKI